MPLVFQYIQLYGGRILLLLILSIVTKYRREISCNRVYGKEEEDDDDDPQTDKIVTTKRIVQSTHSTSSSSLSLSSRRVNHNPKINLLVQENVNDMDCNIYQEKEKEENQSFLPCSKVTLIPSHMTMTQKLHLLTLPQDLHIHIMTFLHPKDIIQFSLCNTRTYSMIHLEEEEEDQDLNDEEQEEDYDDCGCSTSTATKVWFTLWKRDYSCVVTDWYVGQEAIQRSTSFYTYYANNRSTFSTYCPTLMTSYLHLSVLSKSTPSDQTQYPPLYNKMKKKKKNHHDKNKMKLLSYYSSSMKDFYFYFGQTWINYLIAGHCTLDSCYIGLHGHVFYLSKSFLYTHPGSLETLLMLGGGRDATKLFESLGHSSTARKIATQQCLIIQDSSCSSIFEYYHPQQQQKDEKKKWGLFLYYPLQKNKMKNSTGSILLPHGINTPNHTTTTTTTTTTSYSHFPPLSSCSRTHPRKPGCTWYYKNKIQVEEIKAVSKAHSYRMMGGCNNIKEKQQQQEHSRSESYYSTIGGSSNNNSSKMMIGSIQIYFDPICNVWMGWYIDSNFLPVFIGML